MLKGIKGGQEGQVRPSKAMGAKRVHRRPMEAKGGQWSSGEAKEGQMGLLR